MKHSKMTICNVLLLVCMSLGEFMARHEHVLSIFVASPSDVQEERNLLDSIVNDINRVWSKKLNLRLELLKWETHCVPSFGEYSQGVINEQIGDDYDIFLGLFWGRFGSPTDKAESGTKEEFDRAYARYCENEDSIDIMVYFKDQPIAPSRMDIAQLSQLNDLKTELAKKNGLYWTFDSLDDFENIMHSHLAMIAQKWSKKLQESAVMPTTAPDNRNSLERQNEIDEEFGLFDYLDIYEDRITSLVTVLDTISDATVRVGNQIGKRTDELQVVKDSGGDHHKVKKIFKMSSEDLVRYAKNVETQVPLFKASRTDAFDALSKGLSLMFEISITQDAEIEGLETVYESIRSLNASASKSLDGSVAFRKSVLSLPRMTTQLNKSKRLVAEALDAVIDEINKTIHSSDSVLDSIETFFDKDSDITNA